MPKLTLLDMTQSILSAMDSDPVNSIDDTVESVQVADLVKEAYFDLISQRDWPFTFALQQLQAVGDVARPTTMRMPAGWSKIKWLKYNKKEVEWIAPEEFQHLIDTRSETPNVVDANGYVINNDPSYWTSFDDDYIVFDGYNKTVESTLVAVKSIAYVSLAPTWTHADSFIPNIPDKFFPTLLAEAKSQAFVNLKQQSNAREERKAQRGRVIMRNEAWRNENGEIKYNNKVNYGRK
jgi:hypothetical protein